MGTAPTILILDEPTRGIDINQEGNLSLHSLANTDGVSVIVISSEFESLIGLCTRVVVMGQGRKCAELVDKANAEKFYFPNAAA